MPRFLVGRRRFRCAIYLHEHELRRIILVLGDIKPRDPGFLYARAGVGKRRLLERLDILRFYVNVNMDDQHSVKCVNLAKTVEALRCLRR